MYRVAIVDVGLGQNLAAYMYSSTRLVRRTGQRATRTGRFVSQSRIASPVGDRGSHYWEISRAPFLVFVSSAHVLAPSGMALHPPGVALDYARW